MNDIEWNSLDKIEKLARGNHLGRFFHHPARYLAAIGFWRFIYPIRKKGWIAQAQTFFNATMEVMLPAATEIFLFGAKTHDSEIRLARFMMKNLRKGDTFCDVGAHFGYFSLLAAHLTGHTGKVISFEASPSTFGTLKKNTGPYSQITPVLGAVSDKNKSYTFFEFPPLYSEYNSFDPPFDKPFKWLKKNPPKKIIVPGQRLDDYFHTHKLQPHIIKIDVEGAEISAIRGMKTFLAQGEPMLVLEYVTGKVHDGAIELAREWGFQPNLILASGELEPCQDLARSMKTRRLDSDNVVLTRSYPIQATP